jgi:chemotaxis protein MotA
MEIATPVGITVAFVAVLGSFVMEGGTPAAMISPPALILVFLGTLGICLASNRMSDVGGIFKAFLRCVLPGKKIDTAATVSELMTYAEIARRDGLLALEEKAKDVTDPFLKRGLELVIDGTDSEEVAEGLEQDIATLRERHKVAAKWFADAGGFAPTLGIIGTVLGLVHALEGLSEPAKLGHAISSAFIATLWGVMSANLMWLPLSNKLKRMSAVEVAHRELVAQGILAIQAGVSPRAVGERLKSHLAPAVRDSVGAKDNKDKAA